ncbi:metallophosphoesterase family protein [Halostagnicola bangensis]
MFVLGDAHASTTDRREALLAPYRIEDPDAALHVGDLEHYDLPAATWFVAGNNEDLDVIDALRTGERSNGVQSAHVEPVRNANLLASTVTELDGRRIGGLSGNYASTQYEKPRSDLESDRRRHFTSEDVERAANLEDVDVFLTHEAPTGLFWYGYDPGCEHVTDHLERLEPDLCLVGHHHRHHEAEIAGVQTVSLAPVWERYYTLDPDELTLADHETPAEAEPPP